MRTYWLPHWLMPTFVRLGLIIVPLAAIWAATAVTVLICQMPPRDVTAIITGAVPMLAKSNNDKVPDGTVHSFAPIPHSVRSKRGPSGNQPSHHAIASSGTPGRVVDVLMPLNASKTSGCCGLGLNGFSCVSLGFCASMGISGHQRICTVL